MGLSEYDLCVIGGGINGAAIARDAAGRGLSVLLLEARDLANGTSSASTKLIHGGLRYLEHLQFRLVRESLAEREILLRNAPHLIRPMEFVLPHDSRQRPAFVIQVGLFFYDHLAARKALPSSYGFDLRADPRGKPLGAAYEKAFCYSDCWADDSRLVVLNAVDAAARGAKILTRHECTHIEAVGREWKIEYVSRTGGKKFHARAGMIINAAGPWVEHVLGRTVLQEPAQKRPSARLVKGSHIIIPRAFEGGHSYILQQQDRRIVFVIPYEREFTLIGTTEENFDGDIYDVRISDEELLYLCGAFNQHFKNSITREDVLWTYSGVRPLVEDGSKESRKTSREYVLHIHEATQAPLMSVFGGKLTTYRVLAEHAVNKMLQIINNSSSPWTLEAPLPGGDFPSGDFVSFLDEKSADYPWLDPVFLERYARAYGTRMDRFLSGAKSFEDLGEHFGAGLTQAETLYLLRFEFAGEAEDILWRRSKVGLHLSEEQHARFENEFFKLLERARAA